MCSNALARSRLKCEKVCIYLQCWIDIQVNIAVVV